MNKLIAKIAMAATLLMPLAFVLPAQATVTPNWDVTGSWKLDFSLDGVNYDPNLYDLTLTQTGSDLAGLGQYPSPGPYAYVWTAVGSISGSGVTLVDTYTLGAVGTIMNMSGTIAADGTMSGIWDDNYGGGRTGTWKSVSGAANITSVPDWGQQLSAASCVGKVGSPVINVTEKVINDVDSGVAGNNWAFDNYNRHIQVWRTGTKTSDTFCALVTYEGTASAVEGQIGPGGTGLIGPDVSAEMKGGYRSTIFTGSLLSPALWPTRGSVGVVDYECTAIDGTGCNPVSWVDKYFSTTSGFDLEWWGWFYYGGTHGNWLNSSQGTFGNIL